MFTPFHIHRAGNRIIQWQTRICGIPWLLASVGCLL